MAIRVNEILHDKGTDQWYYEYSYDTTQKELVSDLFFNRVLYATRMDTTITEKHWDFVLCDFDSEPLQLLATSAIKCPKSITISINDNYKFAQASYRQVAQDYTWMCTDIYQDQMKVSTSIKGIAGECAIGDLAFGDGAPADYTDLLFTGFDLALRIMQAQDIGYSSFFDKMRNGMTYSLPQASIEVGIINNPFSSLSWGFETQIIPTTYLHAIDDNEIFDLSMDLNVDGRVVIGKLIAHQKTIRVYNQGHEAQP